MCIYVDNYVDNCEDFKSCVILYMRIIRVKYVLNKRKQTSSLRKRVYEFTTTKLFRKVLRTTMPFRALTLGYFQIKDLKMRIFSDLNKTKFLRRKR